MPRTTLQLRVIKTGAFAGAAVDVSALTGDYAVKLRIYSLTAGNNVRFVLEETVDNFATTLPTGNGLAIQGGNLPVEGDTFTWNKRDLGRLSKFGVASGKARLNLSQMDGGSIDYESWIIS